MILFSEGLQRLPWQFPPSETPYPSEMDITEGPEAPSVHIRLKAAVHDSSLRAAHGVELSVPQTLGRKGLRNLLHHLLNEPESRPEFHFLAASEPLRSTLDKFLLRRNLSTEATLELTYYLPLPAPESDSPHVASQEWLSAVDVIKDTHLVDPLVLAASYSGCPSVFAGDDDIIAEDAMRDFAHRSAIKDVAWLPSHSHFVSASNDQSIRLWSFNLAEKSARPVAVFRSDEAGPPFAFDSVAVSSQTSSKPVAAAMGGADGSVWVIPGLLAQGEDATDPTLSSGVKRKSRDERMLSASRIGVTATDLSVSSIQWHGEDVITAGWDGLVHRWDVGACATTVSIPCGGKSVTSVSVSDSSMLVSAVDGAVRLVDARDGKGVVAACGRRGSHRGIVADACWLTSTQSAVSAGLDGSLRFWDMRSMLLPTHIVENVHGPGGRCLSVSVLQKDDRHHVFSAGSDGRVARHHM